MKMIKGIRSVPTIVALGAIAFWSSSASAMPITVEFEVSGFSEGATLRGSFTGEDSNNTGTLEHGNFLFFSSYELSAFSVEWSGNSTTPGMFTHSLGNLRRLIYDIGNQTLFHFSSEGGGSSASYRIGLFGTSASVNGPYSPPWWKRDTDKQKIRHPGVTTTTVPEPGTLTLFGLGLLAIGVASRRRRSTA